MKITNFAKLFALTLAVSGLASVANAQSTGTFGFGIELLGSGAAATNNGVTELYALDQSGGSRLTPSGSTSTLNSSWTNSSNDNTVTFNLGTFTLGSDSLTLQGGSLLTYENGGDFQTVGSQYLNYSIGQNTVSGSYSPVNLPTTFFNVSGNSGDDRWSNETAGINLLSGLTPGNYILSTYGFSGINGNSGDNLPSGTQGSYDSNGGANYAASFMVLAPVPESSSVVSLVVAFAGLLLLARRRSVEA